MKDICEFRDLQRETFEHSTIRKGWLINVGPEIVVESDFELQLCVEFQWQKVLRRTKIEGVFGRYTLSESLLSRPFSFALRPCYHDCDAWSATDLSALLIVLPHLPNIRTLELARVQLPFRHFFPAVVAMEELESLVLDNIISEFVAEDFIPPGSEPIFFCNLTLTIKGRHPYDQNDPTYQNVPITRMMCCNRVRSCRVNGNTLSLNCNAMRQESSDRRARFFSSFTYHAESFLLPAVHELHVDLLQESLFQPDLRIFAQYIRRLALATSRTLQTLRVESPVDVEETIEPEACSSLLNYSGPLSFVVGFLHPDAPLRSIDTTVAINNHSSAVNLLRGISPLPRVHDLSLNVNQCSKFDFVYLVGTLFPNIALLTIWYHNSGSLDKDDLKAIGKYVSASLVS
ncbi:hypothetical protein V5O48_013340 [Marasmius crinis-equi]|uniref:Uncharacterized protein n=1 Tax=Marasmius crinis-equi TaxID=585013 RepID=A0ABR3F0C2_9AGAR